MTLPTELNLHTSLPEMRDDLMGAYNQLAFAINGDLQEWTPILSGTSSDGIGTYTRQFGLYLMQPQVVDVWLDLAWSAHTGTGNMRVNLPLECFGYNASAFPYIGVVEDSSLDYSAGYSKIVLRAIPGQSYADVIQTGDNVASLALPMDTAGTLRAHIRYLRQQNQ